MNGDETPIPAEDELEEAFTLLQAALSSLPDPPALEEEQAPAEVLEGARWVHDWVNMDAELARLTHDSSLDPGLASVRSSTSLRRISFECDDYEIEIEIEPSERGVSMTGTISPPTKGVVRAVIGGISHEGTIDDYGTFLIDDVNHGVVMAYVTAKGQTIRLGSFEV